MTEISERAVVRRLNDRLGFGPAPGDLEAGVDATVRRLLGPTTDAAAAAITPPTGLEPPPKPKTQTPNPNKEPGGEGRGGDAKKAARRERSAQERRLMVWWLDRMVASRTAGERLTWFWHGHFATSNQKVRNAAWMLAQNQTQRRLALGQVGDLAQAMIVDNAMIRWLDGQRNRKGAPNENLAREFMELFTLGIGHYQEADVQQGARCLTGWALGKDGKPATFQRRRFDSGSKTVLGKSGDFDAKGFAALTLAQPASAAFVIGRLWFRLVSATPPPSATIARLSAAYGSSRSTARSGGGAATGVGGGAGGGAGAGVGGGAGGGAGAGVGGGAGGGAGAGAGGGAGGGAGAGAGGGDVRSLLMAMVAEPGFKDPASSLVKQPVEWTVGLLRALGLRPGKFDEKEQTKLLAGLRGMGQLPYRPPSVGGWPAGASWLTTSSGVTRLQLAQQLTKMADLSTVDNATDRLGAVGALLGVDNWSERTRSALAALKDPAQLTAVAACAPEYVVSG